MAISDPSPLSQTHEMSLTLADFERLLPKVENIKNINKNNNLYRFNYLNEVLEITLERFTERKIASLSLSVIFIRFEMKSSNQSVFNDFMEQFFKTFQRGGG